MVLENIVHAKVWFYKVSLESPKITTKIIRDLLSEANWLAKMDKKVSILKAFYRTEISVEINRLTTISI